MDADEDQRMLPLTAEIVAAYVGNNQIPAGGLPALVQSVFGALAGIQRPRGMEGQASSRIEGEKRKPPVPIGRSIAPDFIVCLEDGARMKSLKRHLMAKHGLTPEQYRAKWNLPPDYPMVAPNYAAERSEIAKRTRRR